MSIEKNEYAKPVKMGQTVDGVNYPFDAIAFLVRDEDDEYEGCVTMEANDACCQVILARINDTCPRTIIETYTVNLFPFDTRTIAGFITTAIRTANKSMKNRDNVTVKGNRVTVKCDPDGNEDIRW